jgi:hypothetical protein
MDELFKEQSQKILIYLAVPSVNDPFEKNESLSELPSLPIDAIVTDLSFSKIQWSMPGISTDSAKEIIVEKKHKTLIEQCYKIDIDGVIYEGWKINGRLQYKIEQEYLRAYIYIKKVN